jgi:hypothetical protein
VPRHEIRLSGCRCSYECEPLRALLHGTVATVRNSRDVRLLLRALTQRTRERRFPKLLDKARANLSPLRFGASLTAVRSNDDRAPAGATSWRCCRIGSVPASSSSIFVLLSSQQLFSFMLHYLYALCFGLACRSSQLCGAAKGGARGALAAAGGSRRDGVSHCREHARHQVRSPAAKLASSLLLPRRRLR